MSERAAAVQTALDRLELIHNLLNSLVPAGTGADHYNLYLDRNETESGAGLTDAGRDLVDRIQKLAERTRRDAVSAENADPDNTRYSVLLTHAMTAAIINAALEGCVWAVEHRLVNAAKVPVPFVAEGLHFMLGTILDRERTEVAHV